MSRRLPFLLLLVVALVAASCGSDPTAPTTAAIDDVVPAETAQPAAELEPQPEPEPTVEEPVQEEAADAPPAADTSSPDQSVTNQSILPIADDGSFDLTNATLVAGSASCEDYVGMYSSTVTDVSTDTDYDGTLTVTTDGVNCTFSSNQIPSHDLGEGSRFATPAGEVDGTWTVPVVPTMGDTTTALGMGASVIMLNGIKWESYPAACWDVGQGGLGSEKIGCGGNQLDNPWRYNIGSPDNNFGFDAWFAHVQPGGLYHYHSTPVALYDIDCDGTAASPVIGFAADGYPVFGPCFVDETGAIRPATSSYQLLTGVRQEVAGYSTPYTTGGVLSDEYNGQFIGDYQYVDGSGDLDDCNGMLVDGQYGYYITGAYPYVLPCWSGVPSTSFR